MPKILSVLIIIILITTGCMNKNEDEIIMVTEAGFAPYEYWENGEIVGVDIEIANEIAKYLNKKLIVKDISFDSIINELNSKKADFAAAGMSITKERLKEVDFSIPYATSKQVIIVKKGSTIKNIEDLNGKKVSVQLGSIADITISEKYPNIILVRQKKFLSASEDVKNGKSDCIVMDILPALELVKNNNMLEIVDKDLFSDSYGIAVKKGNKKLLDAINIVLERLIKEGKIEQYTIDYTSE